MQSNPHSTGSAAGMKLRMVAIASAPNCSASCDIRVVGMFVMRKAMRGGTASGMYEPSASMTTVLISYGVGCRL